MCQPPTLSLLNTSAGAAGWRWLFLCCLLLSGCSPSPYELSSQYSSANQSERIAFLILHYTGADDADSLRLLTNAEHRVSAHYLIPREHHADRQPVYQLVPDSQRAWHAGSSHWHHQSGLNASSIGIEIVNPGYLASDERQPLGERRWQPYHPDQIHALGALAKKLVERYQIPPTQVLGHSDVAPERKQDPGPHFPWRTLYLEYGVGAWPDESRVTALLAESPPSWTPLEWQQQLSRYGYAVTANGEWDEQTRLVLQAFQLHFRPQRIDGQPDQECQAILMALLEKYP